MNARSPQPPPTLDRAYDGVTATFRTARAEAVEFLAAHGADEETGERAALVVSELVSNAVQVAPGRPYNVHLAIVDRDQVSLTVRNHTEGMAPPPHAAWGPDAPLAPRGRGLLIIDTLSDTVRVERNGNEITVTATLPFRPSA